MVDDDTKSIKCLVEEDAKSIKGCDVETIQMEPISDGQSTKSEAKKKLSKSLKSLVQRRIALYIFAFLIFIISIFTHNLTDFSNLIVDDEFTNSTDFFTSNTSTTVKPNRYLIFL